ncbi:MAG: hypothetical protein R3308_03180 [Thiohalobacterales bacterium]|nr:hypothetical protein [Thiohalobacterales bacterium]
MAIALTVILITAILVGLFLLLQNRSRPSRARKAARAGAGQHYGTGSLDKLRENSFFWGAELWQPGCAESYKLLGKQYRFEDAPVIPLDGCGRKRCTCQFKGLRDRRSRPRRIHPDRRSEVRFDKTHPDRRVKAGRRREDRWVNHTL